MKKENKYFIKNANGRYLGASIWTYDIDRALRLQKKDADKMAKGYINVSVVEATN